MKSHVLTRTPVTFASFGAGALGSSSCTNVCDAEGIITGFHGSISRWEGEAERTVAGATVGYTALALLSDGRIAAAERTQGIAILSSDGAVTARLDTGFGAPTDWLAVGGEPERLYAATTWSGSKKSGAVAELDLAKGTCRHLSFKSMTYPSMSEHGICRVNVDQKIAEYAFKGAAKARTQPIAARGPWQIARADGGWLVFTLMEGRFLDLEGRDVWSTKERLPTWPGWSEGDVVWKICPAGGDRILVVTHTRIHLIDCPRGGVIASCERQLRSTREAPRVYHAVWDGGARAAIAADAGLEVVEGVPG